MEINDRHVDLLIHIANGLKADEIGKEMGISRRTVEAHIDKLKAHLRAKTIGQLIYIAVIDKIIE